jgi:hypothetical protein
MQLTKAFEVFTDTLNAKASTCLQPVQMLQNAAKVREEKRRGEGEEKQTDLFYRISSLTRESSFALERSVSTTPLSPVGFALSFKQPLGRNSNSEDLSL